MSTKTTLLGLSSLLALLTVLAVAQTPLEIRETSEQKIDNPDFSNWIKETFRISADNRRLAYVTKLAGLQIMQLDGKIAGTADQISTPVFSPDGKRLAFAAAFGPNVLAPSRPPGAYVVLDGKGGERYADIGRESLTFSPDSQRLAYAAKSGSKWFAVIDSEEQAVYDNVGSFTFSPDSAHIAYLAHDGQRSLVVLDGKESPAYQRVLRGSFSFSPDSRRFAYAAREGANWFVIIDGKPGKQHAAVVESGNFVLDAPGLVGPVFSIDGTRVAYGAREGSRWVLVVDGQATQPFEGLTLPTFSRDSTQIAYGAKLNGNWSLIVNDKVGPTEHADMLSIISRQFIGLGGPWFSPDSTRLAYVAQSRRPDGPAHQFVVVNGAEMKRYDGILEDSVLFSPDGNHIAYAAKSNNKWVIVIDEVEHGPYDDLNGNSPIVFSPDGRHVAYTARISGNSTVALDGKAGKSYAGIVTLGGGRVVFDAPDRFHYIADKGDALYLVEELIKSDGQRGPVSPR